VAERQERKGRGGHGRAVAGRRHDEAPWGVFDPASPAMGGARQSTDERKLNSFTNPSTPRGQERRREWPQRFSGISQGGGEDGEARISKGIGENEEIFDLFSPPRLPASL